MKLFNIIKRPKINNKRLNVLLSYRINESQSFETDKKHFILLGINIAQSFKKDFNIESEINNYIPLIDLYDNDYLFYNIEQNKFQMYNIVQELAFATLEDKEIDTYIKIIKKVNKKKN